MSGLKRALIAIAVAGLAAGIVAAALSLSSDHVTKPGATISLGLFITFSFIGVGLYAWWRRPQQRFGALMVLVGFLYALASLMSSNASVLFTIGVLLGSLHMAAFAHMVLSYPDGRLSSRNMARLVGSAYVLAIVAPLPWLLLGDPEDFNCTNCPPSAIRVADNDVLARALDGLTTTLAVILIGIVLAILVRRWRDASRLQRRAMAPVLWSAVVLLVLLAASLTSFTVGATGAADVLGMAGLVAFASTPWAFLFGLVRSRVVRAGAVSELLRRMGETPEPGPLRDLLSTAVDDRSLTLVYWLEDKQRWVDAEGRPTELPEADDPTRAWTPVELEGTRVGAIVHDRSLLDEPDVVRSVAAAAGLAVQNERLAAQLRARVEELHTSRARLIDVALDERRRLERNLHDGAQQRLVALSLTLRLAQAKLTKDPESAESLLSGAHEELNLAIGELRELARGIHPAVLSDRGLEAALEALAGRSPVPVVVQMPRCRLPYPVEAAAYYVVAEALTNIVRYADASEAKVSVARRNGHAIVEVADDGVGGADPTRGSGLRGLADRVAALDGRLQIDSPPGAGTTVRVEFPV
jgi:signal transduction histidine kinase